VAQKVDVRLVDDVDGSEASETIEFALEGRRYELDLSDENAAKLRGIFAPYVDAARRTGGGRGGRRRGRDASAPPRATVDREKTTAIRVWARENGHEVSDRGRISKNILEAYEEAQRGGGRRSAVNIGNPFNPEQVAS
jgi:hypothetical protein